MSKQAKQQIRACTFEMEISQGSGNIKFPCSCYVQWKTINGKDTVKSANRVKLEQRKLLFNETINLTTHMILDFKQEQYHKKDSILVLNLISNSRPNEPKLVGRVNVQLGKIANQTYISEFKKHTLQFCSVEATLTFRVSLKASLPTNLALSDLQRSDYIDLQPLVDGRQSQIDEPKIQVRNPPAALYLIQSSSTQEKKERGLQKLSQSSFQERLSRLKAENQNLKGSKLSENFNSRVKREIDQKIKVQQQNSPQQVKQSNKQKEKPKQQRVLQTDFSVPMLAKDSDQFDSNKILENSFNEYDRNSQKNKSIFRPKDNENISSFNAKTEQLSQASFKNREIHGEKQAIKSQAEISNLKFLVQKLQVEKSILENQLNKKNADQLQLNKENQKLIEKISTLSTLLQEKEEIIESIQNNNNQNKLQQAIMNLQERQLYIAELEQKNRLSEEKLNQALLLSNTLYDGKQVKGSIVEVKENHSSPIQVAKDIEELKFKLQQQERNHSNSKIELNEVREWYKLLQEQNQGLTDENKSLKQHIDLLQMQNQELKIEIQKLSQLNQRSLANMEEKQQKQQKQANLINQLIQLKNQLTQAKEYIQHSQQIERTLNLELQSSKHQLELMEVKYLEFQSEVTQLNKQAQILKHQNEQKNNRISDISISLSRKSEQCEDLQKKSNDLIKRLKQKQQNVLKAQRDSQQLQSKLKITQNNFEKLKQKISQLQSQRTGDRQKITTLEKDLRLLKAKYQKQADFSSKQLEKLRQKLQNESNKRKQLALQQKQTQSKLNSKILQAARQNQLQDKISKHVWKEKQLKEQLTILETQLVKISQVLQEKEDNEDKYAQSIVIVTNQNNLIRARISEIEKQCELLIERNQGLQAEIELLNAYQPNEESSSQVLQLNKKLVEKNKQLLNQIEERNQAISSLERSEGTMKGKQVQQMLSKSRIQKQKGEIKQKYQSLLEENEKLEQYISNLNQKYQQQIKSLKQTLQATQTNSQSKIEELYSKLTQQQLKYVDQQMKFKEQIDSIQQDLHEKQYQLQYQKNQSRQLALTFQALKEKLATKEIELLDLISKISQQQQVILQYHMIKEEHNLTKSTSQRVVQQLQSSHSKIKFYQDEIEKLHEKEFLLEKQVITLSQQLSKLKENGDEQIRHIGYLEGQIKNFRERQTQYIEQIEKLQSTNKLTNSKYSKIEKDKNQLNSQIEKLTQEIRDLQSKKQKQSSEGTPVNKFKSSPSPQKQSIDLSDVVNEINAILSRRKEEEQLQNALRLVIDNNSKQEEQFQRWNRERGLIQQKAKLISKQLQKIKASILKTPNRTITQKTSLSNLLKPAEAVVNDLVKLSQTLIQMDPFEEQEEEFQQNGVSG